MQTILQFRRALEFIKDEYPFSPTFGSVRTREGCVASAQELFERLMVGRLGIFLDFDVLCLTAKDEAGNIDRTMVKDLIRVFRPNRLLLNTLTTMAQRKRNKSNSWTLIRTLLRMRIVG